MSDIEEKIVFGLAAGTEPNTALLMLGIPAGAWNYMKDGKTNTLDLRAIGLPVQIIMYGAPTHDAAIAVIHNHNAKQGRSTIDLRREDFTMKPASEKRNSHD